jgi:hypothetical protein
MGKTTIDRRWLPLNALRAFECVAKHSSFTAAGNALLISQSALSRHVIALEKLIERFGTGGAAQSNLHLAVSNE